MKITNNASFPIIAFGWQKITGYADDVLIAQGETRDVNGPYIGEMGGGSCYIHLTGELVCQETPDDDKGMCIGIGAPISIGFESTDDRGLTVRHHSEPAEDFVVRWRESRKKVGG